MSEEIRRNAVETEFAEEEQKETTTEAPKEETPKAEEKKPEKKENPVVKVFKAVGNGIVKTGSTIGGAIKKHPYIGCGISGVIGYGVKAGLDYLKAQSNSEEPAEITSEPSEPLCLPETEEPAEITLDDPTTEEVVAEE